ncbi:hypothetical protein [Parendozoicomonas sp. Alg238-R29]|uniref:hypothetical protein n=1 Tax=Parendozoicomonas sp. Alg238-R29 TaxID=2993446 RepID=UPI00248F2FBE|nr:hypothetical protein [Parendozoicomonas sp. Alg238-R29]
MKKVIVFSLLLLLGIVLSQALPYSFGASYTSFQTFIMYLTMVALSYIMIDVGSEFDVDKKDLGSYGWDYVVAMTAATFPWLFVVVYFIFVLSPSGQWFEISTWKEMLLLGRFAAPTSAGVLFAMLAAADLSTTWMFKKARILAVFDDLDTVLLMVPLTILMVGLSWQLVLVMAVLIGMLAVGYKNLRTLSIPCTWRSMLGYAFLIATTSKLVLLGSKAIDPLTPVHIEVLLPAFLLGCMIKPSPEANPHDPERVSANTVIAGIFMVLVGLSMPLMELDMFSDSAASEALSPWGLPGHVLAVTVISNLGKMFPLFCYKREASFKERLALSIGMFPRGEVGAGVLIISLGYGIGGQALTIAMLSLTLNLFMTGFFIMAVRALLNKDAEEKTVQQTIPRPVQVVMS